MDLIPLTADVSTLPFTEEERQSHRYWSVVESRRLDNGSTAQRQVLYLGEINDSQHAAWRKSLEVFDEDRGQQREVSLFPDDRPVPADALDAVSIRLSEMKLVRAALLRRLLAGLPALEGAAARSFLA